MKQLSGQNTLLALSIIAVFAISGCFFNNAENNDTAQLDMQGETTAHQASLAIVK